MGFSFVLQGACRAFKIKFCYRFYHFVSFLSFPVVFHFIFCHLPNQAIYFNFRVSRTEIDVISSISVFFISRNCIRRMGGCRRFDPHRWHFSRNVRISAIPFRLIHSYTFVAQISLCWGLNAGPDFGEITGNPCVAKMNPFMVANRG